VRQCLLEEAIAEAMEAGASDLSWKKKEEQKRREKIMVTVISVQDQGRGIPESEFGSLFGEFVQLGVSDDIDRKYASKGANVAGQTSGSGLGLHLVLKFVTRMHGHIWAKNSEAGGAVFSFCFPAGDTSLVKVDSDLGSRQALKEISKEEADTFQVLLVDDSGKFFSNLLIFCWSEAFSRFVSPTCNTK